MHTSERQRDIPFVAYSDLITEIMVYSKHINTKSCIQIWSHKLWRKVNPPWLPSWAIGVTASTAVSRTVGVGSTPTWSTNMPMQESGETARLVSGSAQVRTLSSAPYALVVQWPIIQGFRPSDLGSNPSESTISRMSSKARSNALALRARVFGHAGSNPVSSATQRYNQAVTVADSKSAPQSVHGFESHYLFHTRTIGRVVEGGALRTHYRGNGVGSNPTSSTISSGRQASLVEARWFGTSRLRFKSASPHFNTPVVQWSIISVFGTEDKGSNPFGRTYIFLQTYIRYNCPKNKIGFLMVFKYHL